MLTLLRPERAFGEVDRCQRLTLDIPLTGRSLCSSRQGVLAGTGRTRRETSPRDGQSMR
jgi:hypothetical protein